MAANNDAFLRSLGDIYKRLPPNLAVSFDFKDCRIQCFPHVINTCVKHTLKALSSDVDGVTQADERDGEGDSDEGSRAAMKTKVVMRAATKMKVVMKAPTSTQALRIGLMVICSTKHEGLSEKYVLLDNDLNVLPMLSKVGTSTAGGRMRKDLL